VKKLVLTTVCVLAVTGAAFAQGTLNWSSIAPNAMTAQTNAQVYSPLIPHVGTPLAGTIGVTAFASRGFYYELLYNTAFTGSQIAGALAPSNSAAALFGGSWLDTGFTATNNVSGTGGRLVPVAGNASASVSGWANGTTNNIVLVGWSSDLGTSWVGVSNILAQAALGNNAALLTQLAGAEGFFGVSACGYINPNLAPAGGATLFATAASQNGLPVYSLNSQLYLLPVPEPATMALAGLGGLSLLLFRRRRQ
jgi:hypothetical protein